MFVALANDNGDEFPLAFGLVNNFAIHDSTVQTPYVLNCGRLLDLAVGDEVPAAYDFISVESIAIGDGKHNVEIDQLRQKSYADCRRHDMECQAGEEGLLRMAPGVRKPQLKLTSPLAVVRESVT